jgi:phage replication O-like protein O
VTRALIPNSTQIPDLILDRWMAELSGAEFKVLLYVARRTYGFGKESDNISLNQMASGIRRRDGTILDLGTGLSRSGVKSACNSLIQLGVLVRINNRSDEGRECEESTYRLNLFADQSGVGQKKAYVGQQKAQVGQKNAGGRPETDRGVGQKVTPQETDQETAQETAATSGPHAGVALDDAAADLVEDLVSEGVGRAAAARFASEKPETCRRCLEYLPYAKIKTTKGAWLANAIRDEYGPPPGYEEGRARLAREREAESHRLANKAREEREQARREERATDLRLAYHQVEEAHGEALKAFNEYVRGERARTDRIALHLSTERRAELLAAFERPERRLELFEAWISSHPLLLSQEPVCPPADRLLSPSVRECQGARGEGLVYGTSS